MNRTFVSTVLTAAVLVLAATTAHAGGAQGEGSATPQSSFFVCHGINGGDLGQTVNISSDEFALGTGSSITNVRVGSAVLGCTQVQVFQASGAAIIPDGTSSQLTCYTISVPRTPGGAPAGSPTLWTALDAFDVAYGLGTESVIASDARYLCAPGTFTVAP